MEKLIQDSIDQQKKEPSLRVLAAKLQPRITALNDKILAEMFIYLYQLTGIPFEKYPQTGVLISYIKSQLPNNSIMDFINAFTLAINGKLDLTADDRNPFNNFSSLYIERIFQSYQRFRFIVEDNQRKNEFTNKIETVYEKSPLQRDQELCDWLKNTIKTYNKHNGEFFNYLSPLFDKLLKRGIIPFTPERLEQIKRRAVLNVVYTARGYKSESMGETMLRSNNSTPEEAYHYLALKEFFEYLTETQTDPEEIFHTEKSLA